MTHSLRALLAGAIDYAGTYPPASLSLAQAAANFHRYRHAPDAWLLGRFVCSPSQLEDLAITKQVDSGERLAVVVPSGDALEAAMESLDRALRAIDQFPRPESIETLELSWPIWSLDDGDLSVVDTLIDHLAHRTFAVRRPTLYFELPHGDEAPSDSGQSRWLVRFLDTLSRHNTGASSRQTSAGFKFRTGGTRASGFPSSARLAAVICACRDRRLSWKATAGLHHPLRRFDPTLNVWAHGFVNVLAAVVMADVHPLGAVQVQAILDQGDPRHFRFTDEAFTFGDWSASAAQIAAARQRALRSFGSCSFDEPCDVLRFLGWL